MKTLLTLCLATACLFLTLGCGDGAMPPAEDPAPLGPDPGAPGAIDDPSGMPGGAQSTPGAGAP